MNWPETVSSLWDGVDAQLCDGDSQGERRSECAHGPCDAVGCGRRHPVSERRAAETESHMRNHDPNAERVTGNEPHVPCIGQEAHWSAGRPQKGRVHLGDRTAQNEDCR